MNILISLFENASQLYYYAIIIYIVMSWFPNSYGTGFHRFLYRICEPYLSLFRKIIPPIARIDFSPIIAMVTLDYATKFAILGLRVILMRFL